MRPVFTSTELADALVVASFLENEGLLACVENQNSAVLVLGLPTPAIPYVVSVPADEVADARPVIEELNRSRPAPRVHRGYRRLWLLGILVLAPGLFEDVLPQHVPFRGFEPYLAAGCFGVFALGLILDIRTRIGDPAFRDSRILTFWLFGAFGATTLATVLEHVLIDGRTLEPAVQFTVVGPVEELSKFLPVLLLSRIRPGWFKDPVAWVVGCASSAAGFGMVEVLFKFKALSHDAFSATLAVTSGLLHPFLGGLLGWIICKSEAGRIPAAVAGLLLTAGIHGAWNAAATSRWELACLPTIPLVAWFYFRNVDRLFPLPPSSD